MKKVLIVKREAEGIKSLLRGTPIEFHYASNPGEAVEVMKTLGTPFDLILMGAVFDDSRRGEATVQGPAFVRKIRESGITTKILMFSCFNEENNAGIAAGANGVLEPNYDEEMKQKLLDALI